MKRLVLLIFVCSLSSPAEERGGKKLWKWSAVALAASSAADVHSSYGMRELNPILRGPDRRFGVSSALMKAGAVGALVLGQKLFLPGRSGRMKGWTAINFSMAATTGAFATHNYIVRYK
jgi:hypothetical protein